MPDDKKPLTPYQRALLGDLRRNQIGHKRLDYERVGIRAKLRVTQGLPPMGKRRTRWVEAFWRRIAPLLSLGLGVKEFRKRCDEEAVEAVLEAYDRQHRGWKSVSRIAREMPMLPPVQQALREKFAAAGFSDDAITHRMHGILIDGKDADSLHAIELYARLTVGFAPTTSKSLQIHGRVDQFFDADAMGSPPPIETDLTDVKPLPKRRERVKS